jgi:hypothetical protein
MNDMGGGMHKKYVSILQDIVSTTKVRDGLAQLAEADPAIKFVKGNLRAKQGTSLTFN